MKSKRGSFVPPNLDNATPEGLADMLGDIRQQQSELKKLEGIYKDAMISRMAPEQQQSKVVRGEKYEQEVKQVVQARFSQEIAKTFLTPTQLQQCYVETTFVQVSSTRILDA